LSDLHSHPSVDADALAGDVGGGGVQSQVPHQTGDLFGLSHALCKQTTAEREQTTVKRKQTIVKRKQTIVKGKQTIVKEKQTIVKRKQTIVKGKQTIVKRKRTIVKGKQTKKTISSGLPMRSVSKQ
jgi:hydroxyacyl-ACP dehydratase HTD2-like protein with hotdog domain